MIRHKERFDGMNRVATTQRLLVRGVTLLGTLAAVLFMVGAKAPRVTAADGGAYTGTAILSQFRSLRQSLTATAGELEITRMELRRAEDLLEYSARYQITSDLAELIYESALREGIDPDLGFRLVNVESRFIPTARSHVGAYGLTQVQIPTAHFYQPNITVEQLLDPETNLRIGFGSLRDLIRKYGDVTLALLAYNRGPTRVKELMDQGRDPSNGFATKILQGYSGVQP